MNLKTVVVPVLLALTFAAAACGDDDSGETATQPGGGAAEATEPDAAAEEEEEPAQSEPAPSGEAARSEKVEIVDFFYQPDPVTVAVGGKVTWRNEDPEPHTATADDGSFDTEAIDPGKLKSETFKEAGTFSYFCEIHPQMNGSVEVVE
jgi:plastocyanin